MAPRVVETSDPAATEAVGAELARQLRSGDVVLVRGDLGSGKTTLVRGAARALGVIDPITSPTFSIGHRYRGDGVMVSHIDLYRLGGLEGEDPGLLTDHLGPGSIAFVEWPEAADAELSGRRFEVRLLHAGGDARRIELEEVLAAEPAQPPAPAPVATDRMGGEREPGDPRERDGRRSPDGDTRASARGAPARPPHAGAIGAPSAGLGFDAALGGLGFDASPGAPPSAEEAGGG